MYLIEERTDVLYQEASPSGVSRPNFLHKPLVLRSKDPWVAGRKHWDCSTYHAVPLSGHSWTPCACFCLRVAMSNQSLKETEEEIVGAMGKKIECQFVFYYLNWRKSLLLWVHYSHKQLSNRLTWAHQFHAKSFSYNCDLKPELEQGSQASAPMFNKPEKKNQLGFAFYHQS